MLIKIKNKNLLNIPIIELYYKLQEIQAYYYSIKHVNTRRDMYTTYIKASEEFLNFNNISNYMNILDENIFNISNKKIVIKKFDKNIESIHTEGFKLLALKIPFNFDELKKAYRVAAKKYHPDVGGSEEDMKILNEAYDSYQNFLLTLNYSDEALDESLFQFKVDSSKVFYHNLFNDLISIYIDTWALKKANYFMEKLTNSNFFQTDLLERNHHIKVDFFIQLTSLSKKFTSINENGLARENFERLIFYKEKYEYEGVSVRAFLANIEEVLKGKQKNTVIIKHIQQVENAYKSNAITEKKYKDFLVKHKKTEAMFKKSHLTLEKYIEYKPFISLPFDIKVKFGFMINYITELDYDDSKLIYDLSTQQQYQYLYTFYVNPEIKLIKKYLYVRLCSYILSINNYEYAKFYINDILSECVLIDGFYFEKVREDKNSKKFISLFISDLKKLQNATQKEYDLIYEDIKSDYYEKLPMYRKNFSIKSTFNFNDIYEDINMLEIKTIDIAIQKNLKK